MTTMASIVAALSLIVAYMTQLMVPGSIDSSRPVTSIVTTTRADYEPLFPMRIGELALQASIADEESERRLGLSNTSMLPDDVAKVFVSENGRVVYIVEDAKPASYPSTKFSPDTPAKYVVETNAGFARTHNITIGSMVTLPTAW